MFSFVFCMWVAELMLFRKYSACGLLKSYVCIGIHGLELHPQLESGDCMILRICVVVLFMLLSLSESLSELLSELCSGIVLNCFWLCFVSLSVSKFFPACVLGFFLSFSGFFWVVLSHLLGHT